MVTEIVFSILLVLKRNIKILDHLEIIYMPTQNLTRSCIMTK